MMFWVTAAVLSALGVGYLWRGLFDGARERKRTRRAALALLICVPGLTFLAYWHAGSVDMPDFPKRLQMARADTIDESKLLQERPLIRQLRGDPQNEQNWIKLILLYIETNRIADARQAYQDAIRSVPHPRHLSRDDFRQLLTTPSP
jgi:cytochrome c-type biogenesis protein CcmH/NrfG